MLVVLSVLGHSFTHLLLHPHYGVRKGITQTRCLKGFIILFVQDKALQKISTVICVLLRSFQGYSCFLPNHLQLDHEGDPIMGVSGAFSWGTALLEICKAAL